MIYTYNIGYNYENDDFYASIEDPKDDIVYEIVSSEEMTSLIKDGVMKHIDDIEGLRKFLLIEYVLYPEDQLVLGGVFI